MNRVLDVRRPRRRRRSSDALAPTVSVLRWPSGPDTDGVFEMFSAQEAGRVGAFQPAPSASVYGENVLFVSASKRLPPDTPAVLLSLANASPFQAVKLSVKLAGDAPTSATGTILTAPPATRRTEGARTGRDASPPLGPSAFRGFVLKGKVVEILVPARSVVVLTVQ